MSTFEIHHEGLFAAGKLTQATSALHRLMTKAKPKRDDRAYHHGDLRRAIVIAAIEVLRETQSTEFSLRELARRAGVSHNAPYKHFAEKRELLGAVSAVGFELLVKRMNESTRGRSTPRARLVAIARNYVGHGMENPALYRLMFGGYLAGSEDGRPVIEMAAAERLRELLQNTFADGALGRPIPKTLRNEAKVDGAILTFWSQMHGLTLLLIDRLVGPIDVAEELSNQVIQAMIDGLAARIPALPPGAWVGPRLPEKSSAAAEKLSELLEDTFADGVQERPAPRPQRNEASHPVVDRPGRRPERQRGRAEQ